MNTVFNPFVRYAGKVSPGHWIDQVRQVPDCRIFYIHGGSCNLILGRRVHSLLPGSLIYVPPHTPYRFTNTSNLQLTAVNFDFTQARTYRTTPYYSNRAYTEEMNQDTIHPNLTVPLVIDDWNAAQRTMTQLSQLMAEQPPYYLDRASAILKLFLIDLIQDSTSDTGTSEMVIAYLRRHCREPITNTEFAQRLNYHPVHLNRLVKQATGMGCRAYIISCRLFEAKQLLLSTDASVTEIAETCGFASASHLARLMKKEEGISPLAYRRNAM